MDGALNMYEGLKTPRIFTETQYYHFKIVKKNLITSKLRTTHLNICENYVNSVVELKIV